MTRKARITRKTLETEIAVELVLDGDRKVEIDTPVPFLNHMLELLARHGGFGLEVKARGDVEIDFHHTTEDLGIVFGQALYEALGSREGIVRYADIILPMDEVLILCACDLGGRPYLVYDVDLVAERVGDFETALIREFFQGLVNHARINLHIKMLAGGNAHHILEGIFKASARALRRAVAQHDGEEGIPSTKGRLV